MPWPSKTPPQADAREKRTLGKGVFRKCEGCGETLTAELLAEHFEVCPKCGHHHRLAPDGRRALLLDGGALERWEEHLRSADPLGFRDGRTYRERIASAERGSGSTEAIEVGRAKIAGIEVGFGAFVFGYLGGSMGSVVGERIARLFERATSERLPVVMLQSSGGARMQEGILSLMQMAKTVGALERLRAAGLPFVSVLLHPTTGGVAASFALLGDVNLAEPNALIGFAGPRVIESTIRQTLPDGFQRAEFLLEHGMIDAIVPRAELKATIASLLAHLTRTPPPPAPPVRTLPPSAPPAPTPATAG